MIRFPKNLSTKFFNRVNKRFLLIKNFLDSRLTKSTLWTKKCLLCDEQCLHASICLACKKDLPLLEDCCNQCALPLKLEKKNQIIESLRCGECISLAPSFTQTFCAYTYEFPIPNLLKQVKYQKRRYWISPISDPLAKKIINSLKLDKTNTPSALIPIPIHSAKRKLRGYNQSELITKVLSKKTGIPYLANILIKTRLTETQTMLSKTERMRNLRNSLEIGSEEEIAKFVKNKHVAVIDDVMTTKSTAELASQLLLRAGAKRVDIWCLARTPKRTQ